MIERIKTWWTRKHVVERSSKERESLTDYERSVILKTGRCPDCGGTLKEGPSGGMSINNICLKCHSEFNLTMIANAVLGERISDKGPRDVGDRAWCYGL